MSATRHGIPVTTPSPRLLSRRRTIAALAVGLPVSVLFLWLAVQGITWSDVGAALLDADPWLVAASVLVLALVYLVQSERWRLIARAEGDPGWLRAYEMVISSLAVNNVVPGRVGEAARGWWLSRSVGAPFARCLSTVVADRIADVGALVVFLALSLPFVPKPGWLQWLVAVTIPVCLLMVAFVAAAWWYSRRSARGRRRAHLAPEERSLVGRHVSGFVRGLADTVSPRQLPAIALLSLVAWGLWAAAAGLVALSLGIGLTPGELLFITAVINLGVAIPSSPGFIGTYQWLAVAALGLFGVDRDEAFAFAVLLQAAWFVPTTVTGLALIGGRGLRRLRSAESDAHAPVG